MGGAEEMKARRGSCTGAAHVGHRCSPQIGLGRMRAAPGACPESSIQYSPLARSPPFGGAEEMKPRRGSCTGADHAGRRRSPRIGLGRMRVAPGACLESRIQYSPLARRHRLVRSLAPAAPSWTTQPITDSSPTRYRMLKCLEWSALLLEKQEDNSGEVSSQHLVGFFKDGCTNLLWRRAARWLDWMRRDEPERQMAESPWIVVARPLCHLQYPVAYLSRLQRILPAARWKLYTLRWPPRPFRRGGLANDTCPWGPRPRLRIPLLPTSSELDVQRAGRISSSPPTAYVFGTGTPVPSPQSQSFSRSYGSILPTSLAYIVPSTRGCSPWRPDAVMSTTGRGRHSVLRIFKGRRERTGHHATCGALPAAGPYLRLSRFQGGQAVKQKR
ncbi:hypothetical protein CQW23_35186 [Capsicum baccatum]|uniref:Protein TAR1 n=1 Tax=Capsicum baccatum TaxID=33114 RepID=A0A2G2UWX4_CAPBA|nr:hypothetical protein CQW23_35186 [Capsicum baccatum]